MPIGLVAPVEVKLRLVRIAAVVPCFNRPDDAQTLLGDLSNLRTPGMDLRVILVDNASSRPLHELNAPNGVHLTHLRLPTNTGGSGGYNAGMARVLGLDGADAEWAAFDPEFVWLVDSDARVGPGTLEALLRVMREDPRIVAAGPAICDPSTGQPFELGGHVNRKTGNFEPMVTGAAGVRGEGDGLVEADYVAACCALVRAGAVRATGLFPDTFLNADDVEWCIRLRQRTGGRIVGVPWARAMHPRFDRFPTWTRYYMARNALGPLRALGIGRRVRLRRALLEVPRAVQQEMMGRHDLARLHVLALRDAARGPTGSRGAAGPGVVRVEPTASTPTLAGALRERLGEGRGRAAVVHPRLLIDDAEREAVLEQIRRAGFVPGPPRGAGASGTGLLRSCLGAVRRWMLGAEAPVAVVPSRGRPDAWFLGRINVQVVPGGHVLRPTGRLTNPACALATLTLGAVHAVRAAWRTGTPDERPWGLDPAYVAAQAPDPGEALSVEVVVLSYNRWPALEATLRALQASPALQDRPGRNRRSITVVDNASTDGTPARVEEFFPGVNLLRLDANIGVEAFDRAVHASTADAVLILDDDAIPEPDALAVAIRRLAERPGLGAVTLHPVHPRTGRSEWRFARAGVGAGLRAGAGVRGGGRDDWPVMGCANLVRRAAWNAVGGYERAYFLYRNDTDLALSLLSAGWGVHFDPALVVRHDTPAGAGARKSLRWHDTGTRNWLWLCRRHGRGASGVLAMLLGWAWAHRLAGLSPARHAATLRGAIAGLSRRAPALRGPTPDGSHLARLIRLQMGRSGR
jgi:GT2 family glycosyltransferase